MPSHYHHAHQKHRLSKRQVSLQHHHDLLFDKCSSLQEFLIFEVDPSIRLKLQRDLRVTQEELEQVQSQLQQVLEELDRLSQPPDLPPSKKRLPLSSDLPSNLPIEQRTQTRISSVPQHKGTTVNSISIEPWIFVLSMVVVWLIVGLSSGNLGDAHASRSIFLGLVERDITPGLPGAFGGLLSGFLGALLWLKSTRHRDQAQVVLMSMGVGMVSGAFVWAILWAFVREFLNNSLSRNFFFGSLFGLVVSMSILLWFDLRRTKL